MIRVRQHVPGYCDGVTPRDATAATTAELLAVPWIATCVEGEWFARNGLLWARPFHRFSVTRDSSPTLIAEYDNGDHWRVLAYILEGAVLVELPEWQITAAGQARVDRWNRGETT